MITFPDHVKSHTRKQISCFGSGWAAPASRSHDRHPGWSTGLNYASEYRNVEGIIIPTKRWVYACEGDYQLVPEPLLVRIDMGEIIIK